MDGLVDDVIGMLLEEEGEKTLSCGSGKTS
jgi:hypothetical protein